MRVPAAPWPFVGRTDEIDVAREVLRAPGTSGLLLVGPAGVGKTRVLDELSSMLAGEGRTVHRAVGAIATRDLPYAALAHLLPSTTVHAGRAPDPVSLFTAVRQRWEATLPAGERAIVVVDDVPLLDLPSLTLLGQLLQAGIATLVATARTDHGVPPVLATMERSDALRRLELAVFDADGVTAVVESALGGTLGRPAAKALWQASQGNLLYLRELVIGALASGSLRTDRGHWRLDGLLGSTSKLVELVSSRLASVPSDARAVAELLAVAEPMRVEDLDRSGDGEQVLALDQDGLVTAEEVDGALLVRLAHPVYGEVLRSQLTPLRQRHLLLRAAAAIEHSGRDADELRLATWRVLANAPVDPALLRRAVRRARAANDFALTERLARAAHRDDTDLEVVLLLAESHYEFGRVDEAEELLQQGEALVAEDADRMRLAVMRHRVLLWGASDADASLEVLAEAEKLTGPGEARTMIRVAIANTLCFHDHPRAAFGAVSAEELAHPVVAAATGFSAAVAHTRLGDPVAGAAAAREAGEMLTRVAAEPDHPHPALYELSEGLALAEAGQLDRAEVILTGAYAVVAEQHIPQLQVWLTLALGRVCLRQGRPITARRWFAEALDLVTGSFPTGRRMALSGLAVSAGQTGDALAAAALLAELDELPSDVAFLDAERHLGRGWTLVALGRRTDAVAAMLTGVDRAEQCGDVVLQQELLYEATRIDGDGRRAEQLRELGVTGDLARTRVEYVAALRDRDTSGMLEAERAFVELGAHLDAAEAAAAAARSLHDEGRKRDASAAASRSTEHATRCEGAQTPGLTTQVAVAPLTARERETAELAARGMASKAIARTLGVSERTVSNHLQRAYVKLGISCREDLPAALTAHR